MISLYKKIKLFPEIKTIQEADQHLSSLLNELDCGFFSYNYYQSHADTLITRHSMCTHHITHWQSHYIDQHYEKHDPIFKRLQLSYLPFNWRLEDELKNQKNPSPIFCDALDFGLKGGFGVPIHGPQDEFGNLVIQDGAVLDTLSHHPNLAYHVHCIAQHYHAHLSSLIRESLKDQHLISLSKRERECLRLTGKHQSAKKIAIILQISPRTVSFHIENAMKKLNAKTKYAALANAIQLGLMNESSCE